MLRAARLLAGLAALIAAGTTFAHTGIHAHVHPHPDVDLYLVLVAAVGAVLAMFWGQTPFSGEARRGMKKDDENGV